MDERTIRGTRVRQEGQLFGLLRGIYDRASVDCDIDICFRPTEDGEQQNPCRDLITEYLGDPSIRAARAISRRLESFTDRRSGLGLLFLISGMEGRVHRIVLSRFPTDEGILADESNDGLDVQFLERVFMKNKHSYKAVLYEHTSLRSGFWEGKAVDKQNPEQGTSFSSNYWIGDFLYSDLSITAAAGTRRLGVALREAARKSDAAVRAELVAAATLATGLRGQSISIAAFEDRYNLSDDARTAIENELKTENAARERFRFDEAEFRAVVGFRSVELDNGGVMTAPSSRFDEIFRRREIRGEPNEIEFSTRGRIVDQRLKKSV